MASRAAPGSSRSTSPSALVRTSKGIGTSWSSEPRCAAVAVHRHRVVNPPGIALSLAGDQQDSPTVAFNGSFLVAWNDRRSGATYDISGTRVDTDGTAQDPDGLALSTGPTDELSPALTNASSWALVYHHVLGDGSGIFH